MGGFVPPPLPPYAFVTCTATLPLHRPSFIDYAHRRIERSHSEGLNVPQTLKNANPLMASASNELKRIHVYHRDT